VDHILLKVQIDFFDPVTSSVIILNI